MAIESLTPELVASLGGLGIARRVLGPSLNELGEALRRLTERRLNNVGRVVRIANEKSASQGENEAPDLRAADAILREAMVAESQIVADYLGGVLASARSDGSDDAVAWTSLVARMSSRELALHYMTYTAIRKEALGHHEIRFFEPAGRHLLRVFFPFIDKPGLSQALGADFNQLPYVLMGLDREGLFEGNWSYGQTQQLSRDGVDFYGGLEMAPSLTGMSLYMWGQGAGASGASLFLKEDVIRPLKEMEEIVVPNAYLKSPLGDPPPPEPPPPKYYIGRVSLAESEPNRAQTHQ